MLEPNPLVNLPDLEQVEWNYDLSVQKMRQLVVKWKSLSIEILRELLPKYFPKDSDGTTGSGSRSN